MGETSVLNEQQMFVRQFIELFKQNPVLWDSKHPNYRNRFADERSEAYEALTRKTKEYYSHADEDFVRMKLESLRCGFRRERRKVLDSQKNCSNSKDVYKPSLWYYDLLLFTVGEEGPNDIESDIKIKTNNMERNIVKIPFWTREHVAMLIESYKNHQCLYAANNPNHRSKRKRFEALKKITESLTAATGKCFQFRDVRRKISLIRSQYLYEYKKIKAGESKGKKYVPNLWYFELLYFLKEQYYTHTNQTYTDTPSERKKSRRSSSDDETATSEDEIDNKKEDDSLVCVEDYPVNIKCDEINEDIFDTIAKNVAHKLKSMTEAQRNIAEKILNDLMYHGQMENLTNKSLLSLDGF